MSPVSKKVEKAGIRGIKKKRKPYLVTPEDFFKDADTCRILFSKVINNDEPDRIALLPSASYGLANVTNNLRGKSGKIILVEEQFPSNVYPWKAIENDHLKIKMIDKPAGIKKGRKWNEDIKSAIDSETLVVSLGHVHWADGTLFDLESIREKTREVGALLIIDGTQSIGALPFDVQSIQPDALICAGYKWLFGPYSFALGYYGPAFDNGEPIEENWINRKGSENFGGLINYEPEYHPKALRYEVGEHSNFILLPMMIAALKQVLNWGVFNINEYSSYLSEILINETQSIGYDYEDQDFRSGHLVGLTPPSTVKINDLQNTFKQKRISVSTRGTSIRVSPNVYNDERDIDRLVKTLKQAINK